MDILASSNTTSVAAASTSQKTAINSDYNTFLKMLTVQLKNQDPLNPMESTDFSVQLATFSGVEQQVVTNQLLENMAKQFSLMNMSQLASWVGKEARASGDVWFSGGPIELAPSAVASADQATVVIRNERGSLIAREDIPVGATAVEWLGLDLEGNVLPAGRYKLTLESSRNGEVIATTPIEYYSKVFEAKNTSSGTVLVLQGGIEVSSDSVVALRDPKG